MKTAAWSLLLCAATLICLLAAVLWANAPAPVWGIGALLFLPLTLGLPSTAAAAFVTSLWQGPPLWAWGVCVVLAAGAAQLTAGFLWRRLRRREAP